MQILLGTETYLISPLVSCKNIVIVKAEILKTQEEKGLDYHRKGIKNQQNKTFRKACNTLEARRGGKNKSGKESEPPHKHTNATANLLEHI